MPRGNTSTLLVANSDRQNNIIRERVANYCKFMADVFYSVAEMRDQKIDPQVVYQSMLASELPDDIKKEAANIVTMVYGMPELSPDVIGFAIFGQCVENMTGIRRQA